MHNKDRYITRNRPTEGEGGALAVVEAVAAVAGGWGWGRGRGTGGKPRWARLLTSGTIEHVEQTAVSKGS